jgi:hypothetical protein
MIRVIKKETIQHLFPSQLKNHPLESTGKRTNRTTSHHLDLTKSRIKNCLPSRKASISASSQCLIKNKWTDRLWYRSKMSIVKLLIVFIDHMRHQGSKVPNIRVINPIISTSTKHHINLVLIPEITLVHLVLT